jgi:GTP-binding protein EngB required for normal cell division
MQIYVLIACDHLEEKQEKKLKENLPDIVLAMQAYADSLPQAKVVLINKCDDLDVEDWQLGIEQSVKKNKQLVEPLTLFNGMAKKFGIDLEIGSVVKGKRKAVSYFGANEGKGDSFMISQYLDL